VRLAPTLFAACALASALHAQEPAADAPVEKPHEYVSKDQHAVLAERERERMHPGEALNLVGIDEGAPEFRAKTPSLERNSGSVAFVDPDALREQRLAMYEAGHVSTRPLPRLAEGDARRAEAPKRKPAPAVEPEAPARPWYMNKLLWLGACAAGVVLVILRRRA
jgi:hypothetical protein